jgi:iron complex transport system substrate-binding protein
VLIPAPWPGAATAFAVILLECGAALPEQHAGEPWLRVPIDRVATTAAIQAAQLAAIGAAPAIVAHTGRDLIWAPEVQARHELILELGGEGPLELEKLSSANAAVVLTNPLSAADDIAARLAPLGIVAIPHAEWLEPHPVGRAEWLHLVAALVGREAEAARILEQVHAGWRAITDRTSDLEAHERPEVFTGLPWRGTWWVPPAHSATAELVRAAGGRWALDRLESQRLQVGSGNLPVDLEAMVAVAGEAEVWLGPGLARTHAQILAAEPRAHLLHALDHGLVLVPDLRLGEHGANDWWEGAVVRPDLALAELASWLHPDRFTVAERRWLRRLERP